MSASPGQRHVDASPSNEAVLPVLEWMVRHADIKQASLRSILQDLSFKFGGYDFSSRKNWIKEHVLRCLRERMQTASGASGEQPISGGNATAPNASVNRTADPEGPPGVIESATRKRRSNKAKRSQENDDDTATYRESPLRFTGLMAPVMLAPELATVCGGQDILPRPWIAKQLHAYVREHELRDPSQGMRFRPDAALAKLFPDRDSVSFFEMNKLLEQHIRKESQCAPEEQARIQAWRQEWEAKGLTQRRKIPAKRARVRAGRQHLKEKALGASFSPLSGGSQSTQDSHRSSTPSTGKRKASGLAQPLQVSEALSDICGGARILSRCEVVRLLWEYIKKQQLQDPNDRKVIQCDAKLQRVFDGETRVTAFGMNRFLGKHLQPLQRNDEVGRGSQSELDSES
jgi:chromatin remodeling complex protein RSC6